MGGLIDERAADAARARMSAAARSAAAARELDLLAADSGFRSCRAEPGPGRRRAALLALDAFFRTGDPGAAEAAVRSALPEAFADARDEAAAVLASGAAGRLVADVARLAPEAPAAAARGMARDALADALAERMSALDPSSPLDLVAGERAVVCYVPGLSGAGGAAATLSSHVGESSSPATIVPDECLARLLHLANVATDDLLAALRARTGSDPSEPPDAAAYPAGRSDPAFAAAARLAEAWADWRVEHDPGRESLASADEIADAIEGCPFGFNAMVAFSADAAWLVGRDWERGLVAHGGMLGLHDLVNGSGCPIRFDPPAEMPDARPLDFVVGEGWECGLPEVHGLTESAFSSEVRDLPPPGAGHGFVPPERGRPDPIR